MASEVSATSIAIERLNQAGLIGLRLAGAFGFVTSVNLEPGLQH
jgi:hypothetical protein